jgi:hypothetical protein
MDCLGFSQEWVPQSLMDLDGRPTAGAPQCSYNVVELGHHAFMLSE